MSAETPPATAGFPLHRRLRGIRRVHGGAALLLLATSVPLSFSHGSGIVQIWLTGAGLLVWLLGKARIARLLKALPPADPDAELLRGMRALLANDRFGAEAVFREMLARNPTDVEATLYLGLVLREHGDVRGSAKILSRALRIDVSRKWTGEILPLLAPVDTAR